MLKIAICDDEEVWITNIANRTKTFFERQNTSIKIDAFINANNLLKQDLRCYDIILLDVNMENLNGIEVAQQIREHTQKAILIYISSFVQYAIKGYSVRAFQYLLKSDLDETFEPCMKDVLIQLPLKNKTYEIKSLNRKIPLSDIVYLQSKDHVVLVHTKENEKICYLGTLSGAEETINSNNFLRVHKSYIVNMQYILMMKSRLITLTTGETITCSKGNYKEVSRRFLLWEGEQ